uniref:EKC/KEOPS complex subunit CGI121 n=3 Tax=Lepeophtheirus salmonis TaxID=72036 RepID=A0A0K2TBI6_LEPSM
MKMDQRWDMCTEGNLQCSLALWKDVKNSSQLKDRILSQDIRDVCFINPTFLLEPFCAVVAANKAAIAQQRKSMITKSILTEILFNLSPSSNIRDALQTFGINDESTHLLGLIFLDKNSEATRFDALGVQGTRIPLDNLSKFSDESAIRKKYKVSNTVTDRSSLVKYVTSKIASKSLL